MKKISKAIIPIAGYATRSYPLNKAFLKAFMPVYHRGIMKPILFSLIEELDEAGIEEIYLVIDPGMINTIDKAFQPLPYLIANEADKAYEEKINRIGKKIKYIMQVSKLGLGHATSLIEPYLEPDESYLMLLGDTYFEAKDVPCIKQVIEAYEEYETAILGLKVIEEDQLSKFGVSTGEFISSNIMLVKNTCEKPCIEYARDNLITAGNYYGNFGIFLMNPVTRNCLNDIIANRKKSNNEYQIMDAYQAALNDKVMGVIINGNAYDVGNQQDYIKVLKKTLGDSCDQN